MVTGQPKPGVAASSLISKQYSVPSIMVFLRFVERVCPYNASYRRHWQRWSVNGERTNWSNSKTHWFVSFLETGPRRPVVWDQFSFLSKQNKLVFEWAGSNKVCSTKKKYNISLRINLENMHIICCFCWMVILSTLVPRNQSHLCFLRQLTPLKIRVGKMVEPAKRKTVQ